MAGRRAPGIRKLLFAVFALCALRVVDTLYLVSITLLEWSTGQIYQVYFYQLVFQIHMLLGLVIILPAIFWNR